METDDSKPGSASSKYTAQHWEIIANGVDGIGTTAMDLWEHALSYFQWCDSSPIYKPEMIKSGIGSGTISYLPIPRPYTITGLCLHLGITREYLYDVAKSQTKNDFFFVANRIIEIIYTQKLEYSITGVFNPIITAKELGLNNNTLPPTTSPVIHIHVEEGPRLLSDEKDVDLPEVEKSNRDPAMYQDLNSEDSLEQSRFPE